MTLAVCTWNRAASLAGMLESAAGLVVPAGHAWEVLVVDNNSTPETRQACAGFESRLPLRCLREPRQGLSHARNRALRECRGDLLIFTDDDVALEPGWLGAYRDAAQAFPDADYFGGRILPLWPRGRPGWLRDEGMALIGGLLVHFDLGEETRPFTADDPLPFGASFALRRRLFERIDPFRADLGVSGNVPGRGEEAEYLGRARAAGSAGVYVGRALCRHLVDERRLEVGHLYRYGVQKGIADARMGQGPPGHGSLATAAGFLARGLVQLAKGRGDRYRQCVINAGIQVGARGERAR